ncbi:hypothetical protein [Algibacter mikhailovii]|uniref:hypothetical protein n=1 Tax=Algibacter mikhailovii TaxID=425498 RepID=UPI002494F206|nr:hypothetical protein [Algibacter mikhailovii]
MKKYTFIIFFSLVYNLGFNQTKIAEFTFEIPGGYSTNITEFTDYSFLATGSDGRDYFLRTDGSDIRAVGIDNPQGSYYFTAQDIDGEGANLPARLFIKNINISGYSNLEFRVHLAEDDAITGEHWDRNDYVHFNYDIDNSGTFSNLLWIATNANGPNQGNRAPQIDSDFDTIGDGPEITDTFTPYSRNLIGTGDLLNIEIEFQLNAEQEDIAIDNIEIWGKLDPCSSAVTWDGTNWSNSVGPDITMAAILYGDYTTSSNIGGFSACSLTLNNANLQITDHTFIEIQNDITVDAGSSIHIESYGSLIQNNDWSSFNNNGNTSVDKETAPMNSSDEYTYWSAPVSGATINGALTESNPVKRYRFNGQNFLDATAETDNNNAQVSGQDDVDDNGDDWQWLPGTTEMLPGVGYATTVTDLAYANAPGTSQKQLTFTFNGDFNNGTYTVPIYRNDSEINDFNWNLIGNPYPSPIDADLFFETNAYISSDVSGSGYIDGAIFLWSQNTIASSTTNGNQHLNFSNNDYAVINLAGEVAGGDGTTPITILPSGHRSIPSGQGFFVSMSNGASADLVSGDLFTTNITFSNAMRIADPLANSQFFKSSNSKSQVSTLANKLWLNLTSNHGVFSQILISYLYEATNNDDGPSYDVPKYPTKGCAMYSTFQGSNKKYAIQAKSAYSLTEEDTISLGFKISIPGTRAYTLSIDHLQGEFLQRHNIYLQDLIQGIIHNLSQSNYSFTAQEGEFNNRFKILFQESNLSKTKKELESPHLNIIQLDEDRLQFSTLKHLKIKTVTIFDLLGRPLYQLHGSSHSEVFSLTRLNKRGYITKVELSNGAVYTKKLIKH